MPSLRHNNDAKTAAPRSLRTLRSSTLRRRERDTNRGTSSLRTIHFHRDAGAGGTSVADGAGWCCDTNSGAYPPGGTSSPSRDNRRPPPPLSPLSRQTLRASTERQRGGSTARVGEPPTATASPWGSWDSSTRAKGTNGTAATAQIRGGGPPDTASPLPAAAAPGTLPALASRLAGLAAVAVSMLDAAVSPVSASTDGHFFRPPPLPARPSSPPPGEDLAAFLPPPGAPRQDTEPIAATAAATAPTANAAQPAETAADDDTPPQPAPGNAGTDSN